MDTKDICELVTHILDTCEKGYPVAEYNYSPFELSYTRALDKFKLAELGRPEVYFSRTVAYEWLKSRFISAQENYNKSYKTKYFLVDK